MNKSKKLFKPEDFDKPIEAHSFGMSNKAKIICCLAVATVVIAGGIFFANSENSSDRVSNTQVVAKESGKHNAENKDSIKEAKDNAKATSSDESENVVANEAKPEVSSANESSVTQPSVPMNVNSDNPADGDVETNARRVIRGDFGNGQVRKDRLGSSYSEIQGRVNEMYRQGLVR